MSPLTPLDVETLQLRSSMRGYDKAEVEQFRAQVMQTLIEYIDQIGRLRMRIGEMEAEVARYRETEDLVKSSVMLAQRSSEEIIGAAKDRAQALLDQARAEGEAVRQKVATLRNEREQFEYEFHALLSSYLKRLEQHNPRLSSSQPAGSSEGGFQPAAAVDPLEQALSTAGGTVAPEPAASTAWNIIPAINPDAAYTSIPADSSSFAPTQEQPANLPPFMRDPDPPSALPAERPARPAVAAPDHQGSTFHAFSEPNWVSPPEDAAAASTEPKRDADIDDFSRALEQP